MSDHSKPLTSRQRGINARAEQRRKEQRRRTLIRIVTPVTVVVLVIGVLVIARLNRDDPASTATPAVSVSGDGILAQLAALPQSTADTVGAGTSVTPASRITGEPLVADGKPRALYIGAEYCPFCASQRWALAIALSRFGSFSGVSLTRSATADIHPDTATLSFHGATYTSDLLSFTGWEIQSNVPAPGGGYTALDTVPPADEQLLRTYDPKGSIPFLDMGNAFVTIGSSYDPTVLAGLDHQQIADAIADPTSAVSSPVLGSANMMTAALCTLTDQQPAAVCTSTAVTAAAATLASS